MKKNINWSYFPKTDPLPIELKETIEIFEKNFTKIDTITAESIIAKSSKKRKEISEALESDDVLKILTQDFLDANYKIETGKKKIDKIRVPVLFGEKGSTAQAFEPDGWHEENKIVLEIERGRAYANNQFLKDIFEASVMVNIDYLVLAVSNLYKDSKDYEKIVSWLETLYATNRIKLSLKGILLIGY
jgi:hypothetical protein|tara:strand:- start:44 stop:607 length:564 start_codon:yes stop_codon:yes gene_type:complete